MKKLLGLSLAAAIALTTQVNAEDTKMTVSSSAALTTNYIWRGISYSNETPTAQMGVDLGNVAGVSGLHVNLWGSGIQEGSEMDTIVGYEFSAGSVGIDVGAINYYYTQDHRKGLLDKNVDPADAGTFAGASYAEAYVAATMGDFGLSVWKELGYDESKDYNGLTFIADASVVGIDISAGTRVDLDDSAASSYFGSIGTSWDCRLIPGYTMGAAVAYNDAFEGTQSLLEVEGLTLALTLSKDF
jgi:uncharacterized protein (TIGR02001 family)